MSFGYFHLTVYRLVFVIVIKHTDQELFHETNNAVEFCDFFRSFVDETFSNRLQVSRTKSCMTVVYCVSCRNKLITKIVWIINNYWVKRMGKLYTFIFLLSCFWLRIAFGIS